MIRKWLNYNEVFTTCIYRASVTGWTITDYHRVCDNKGPILILIKANGRVFGGCTQISWNSSQSYIPDKSSFLFSVDNNEKYKILPNKLSYAFKADNE